MTIYLASRYRATTEELFLTQLNTTKLISRDIVLFGHDVIVPHLYYPLFLDDDIEDERTTGMESAKRLLLKCDVVFAYVAHGVSYGMKAEIEYAKVNNISVVSFTNKSEFNRLIRDLDLNQDNDQ